jgi:adenosine deaminase/adenosine deaminase CECR1
VPFVLSTDDAGILRTNLTQQYVIAALRYPELKYEDFRKFALNSIKFSFLPSAKKSELEKKLEEQLDVFERVMSL